MRGLSPEDFESCVEEALASIPAVFRKYLENVVVVVEEEPSREDYDESDTPDEEELFGIFRGVPFFDRAHAVSALPAQIAIFRGPILRLCETRGEADPRDPRHRRPRDRARARARGRRDALLAARR